MRIVIDARMAIAKGYGIGRYVYNLIENLAAIDRRDEFTLLVNDDFLLPIVNKASNFKLLRVNIKWLSIEEQIRIPMLLNKLRLNLFHAASFAVPVIQPCRTVAAIYDLIHMVFPEHYTWLHRLYYQIVLRQALRNAKMIITISESSKKDLLSYYDIPDNKIAIAYPAVESKFRPISDRSAIDDFKRRHGLPGHFILHVGNRKKHKNIPGLIAAYSLLNERNKESHFLVLSGPRDNETAALVGKFHVESRIIFAGDIAEDELPLIYNAADVFVFPSLYEGFGLPPLEAMACGVPVVTSNVSSLPEVVGPAGVTIDPKNSAAIALAIAQILSDANFKERLIKRGLAQAQRFSWENCARSTLKVYEKAALMKEKEF